MKLQKLYAKTRWSLLPLFMVVVLAPAYGGDKADSKRYYGDYEDYQNHAHQQKITHKKEMPQFDTLVSLNDLKGREIVSSSGINMYSASSHASNRIEPMDSFPGDNATRDTYRNDQAMMETLGTVKEIVVDTNQDRVYYVVLSSDGRFYPVPWSAFGKTNDGRCALDITPGRFREAPNSSNLDIIMLNSPTYREQIRDFYSRQITQNQNKDAAEKAMVWINETLGPQESPQLTAFSDLAGLDVQNQQDETLAELKNVVVDVRKGNLVYGLVNYGGLWGIGEKTAAVPWRSLTLRPDQGVARLDATQNTLDTALVEANNIQQLNEAQFARRIHDNFNTEPYWEVYGFVPPQSDLSEQRQPWTAGSSYNRNFDPDKVVSVTGTIVNISEFHPEPGAYPGTRLTINTSGGDYVVVYAGPSGFAQRNNVSIQTGREATVTGSKTWVNGKSVMLASEIRTEGMTLILRDEQGTPIWDVQQLQEYQEKQDAW